MLHGRKLLSLSALLSRSRSSVLVSSHVVSREGSRSCWTSACLVDSMKCWCRRGCTVLAYKSLQSSDKVASIIALGYSFFCVANRFESKMSTREQLHCMGLSSQRIQKAPALNLLAAQPDLWCNLMRQLLHKYFAVLTPRQTIQERGKMIFRRTSRSIVFIIKLSA